MAARRLLDAELLVDVRDVRLRRVERDELRLGDLGIGEVGGEVLQDDPLAVGQPLAPARDAVLVLPRQTRQHLRQRRRVARPVAQMGLEQVGHPRSAREEGPVELVGLGCRQRELERRVGVVSPKAARASASMQRERH